MAVEYEARVLEIDREKIEKKLVALGAEKQADFDYRRRIYNFNPATYQKWIRLRTDGIKSTLTIKEIKTSDIDGTIENEIVVSDFDETDVILNKLGYFSHSYQENKRTRYILDGVEIDIDTWPYIPTYVEIEGKSIEDVERMIKKLELENNTVTSLDVQGVYREYYKIDISFIPEITFEAELDEKYRIK